MTDCERLEDAFSEWLDGAGESGNGPLMEAHLAACAACRLRIQEYGEMRRLLRSLEDAPARPPAEILRNVLRVVAPGEVPPSSGTAGGGVEAERAGGPATGAPPAVPPRAARSRTGPALIGTALGAILSIPVALWASRVLEQARPAAGAPAAGAAGVAPVGVADPDPGRPPFSAARVPPAPALPPDPPGGDPAPAGEDAPSPADPPTPAAPPGPPPPLPLGSADGDPAFPGPGSPPPDPPAQPAQTEPDEPRPIRPAGVLEGTPDIVVRIAGKVVLDTTDEALVGLLKDLVRETSVRAELSTEIRPDTLRITISYHGRSLAHVEHFENKARKILDANPGSTSSVAWYRDDP